MADGEGYEVGKVKDVLVHHARLEIGVVSIEDAGALSSSRRVVDVVVEGVEFIVIHELLRRWKVEHSSIMSLRYVGSMISKNSPHDSVVRRAQTASSWGPKGNSRKGCLISAVGPEDDIAPFLFFKAGTTVFLPREDDIVYLHLKVEVQPICPKNSLEKKSNLEEMLSKFISVSETHFQNTETALKNQQASIQGLETQIGQLSKLISERPQGSLPSNTEPNPREQLNVINVQDEEGFIEPEPEPRQETVVSRNQGEACDMPVPSNRS
ncbi:hypothetical protein GOBAR_AA35005 [Gossypium barbadense]|uniref:Uncharacterized protein n=1 Tax=Gossypium barbadense TaxID=3634 RepID=A0A2P5W3K1_GOSBA|nr:hypothetical protein GOBAR_AA35005 [Gossypium barbadense]